jgi:hypothetical protein
LAATIMAGMATETLPLFGRESELREIAELVRAAAADGTVVRSRFAAKAVSASRH